MASGEVSIIVSAKDGVTRVLAGIEGSFRNFGKALSGTMGQLGLGLGIVGAVNAAKNLVNSLDAIGDAADNLGVTTDAFQALQGVASTTGNSFENVVRALEMVKKAQAEAGSDTKLQENLKALGVSVEKFRAMKPEDALALLGKGFAEAADGTRAYSAVSDIFGSKVGPKMVAMLRQIAGDGLDPVIAKMRELGQVQDEVIIKQASEISDKATMSWKKWGVAVAQAISDVADAIGQFSAFGKENPLGAALAVLSPKQWGDAMETAKMKREGTIAELATPSEVAANKAAAAATDPAYQRSIDAANERLALKDKQAKDKDAIQKDVAKFAAEEQKIADKKKEEDRRASQQLEEDIATANARIGDNLTEMYAEQERIKKESADAAKAQQEQAKQNAQEAFRLQQRMIIDRADEKIARAQKNIDGIAETKAERKAQRMAEAQERNDERRAQRLHEKIERNQRFDAPGGPRDPYKGLSATDRAWAKKRDQEHAKSIAEAQKKAAEDALKKQEQEWQKARLKEISDNTLNTSNRIDAVMRAS